MQSRAQQSSHDHYSEFAKKLVFKLTHNERKALLSVPLAPLAEDSSSHTLLILLLFH